MILERERWGNRGVAVQDEKKRRRAKFVVYRLNEDGTVNMKLADVFAETFAEAVKQSNEFFECFHWSIRIEQAKPGANIKKLKKSK